MATATSLGGGPTTFQDRLDAVTPGKNLVLVPQEVRGPIHIRKPLILDGQGSTVWADTGPVVRVECAGVKLRRLRVELIESAKSNENCALHVAPGLTVELDDIEVHGGVVGITGEEGDWVYPRKVALGQIPYRKGAEQVYGIRVSVPVPCKVQSHIDGMKVSPSSLTPGMNEIHLHFDFVPRDALIYGDMFLTTAFVKRRIPISGSVSADELPADTHSNGSVPIVWEPERTPVARSTQSTEQAPTKKPQTDARGPISGTRESELSGNPELAASPTDATPEEALPPPPAVESPPYPDATPPRRRFRKDEQLSAAFAVGDRPNTGQHTSDAAIPGARQPLPASPGENKPAGTPVSALFGESLDITPDAVKGPESTASADDRTANDNREPADTLAFGKKATDIAVSPLFGGKSDNPSDEDATL